MEPSRSNIGCSSIGGLGQWWCGSSGVRQVGCGEMRFDGWWGLEGAADLGILGDGRGW